jgi:hypothetical protein
MYEEHQFAPVVTSTPTQAPELAPPESAPPSPWTAREVAPPPPLPAPESAPPPQLPAPQPTGPTILVWQLLLIIMAVGALITAIVVLRSRGTPPASAVKIPIELRGWPGGPQGVLPVVRVRIGDGPPLPVLLDTGSTGLAILAKDLPAGGGAVPLGPFTESFGGGSVIHGDGTLADVSIDGVSTTRKITIGSVRSAGCVHGAPHCVAWIAHGLVGVLGIRADPGSGLTNPLAALPRRYTHSWSVGLSSTSGTLELGAPIPTHPTASFPLLGVLPGDSSPAAGTAPSLAQAAGAVPPTSLAEPGASGVDMEIAGLSLMCWQVARHAPRDCVPTVFDTGSTDTVLFSRSGAPPTHVVRAGKPITGWSPSAGTTPLWSFTSGAVQSDNVVLTDGHRLALMDTGIAAFYAYTVTYDVGHGQMYLTPGVGMAGNSAWRQSAAAVCSSFTKRAGAAIKAGPHAGPTATLAQTLRAETHYLKEWGRWSLKTDDALAGVDLPPALRPAMALALQSDRGGARMMLRFAATVPRYRTMPALKDALTAFGRSFKAAESGWEWGLARMKIPGCS